MYFLYVPDLAIAQASDESLSSQFAQAVVLPTVAGACHVFMHGLNITEVWPNIFWFDSEYMVVLIVKYRADFSS